jgi:hypothetical protein
MNAFLTFFWYVMLVMVLTFSTGCGGGEFYEARPEVRTQLCVRNSGMDPVTVRDGYGTLVRAYPGDTVCKTVRQPDHARRFSVSWLAQRSFATSTDIPVGSYQCWQWELLGVWVMDSQGPVPCS